MIYTTLIKKAIQFSIKIHEVDQQQKRKGKDIPYITHPLSVGLILARSGASEEVIAAGILHDTIEDSIPEKKVTQEMLAERFGENVAVLVASVTEFSKELPWEVRKREAQEHIKTFSHESLLLKSADILNNASELVDDYEKDGDAIFARFNASKEKILKNYFETIALIIASWPDNPLVEDLQCLVEALQMIGHKLTEINVDDYFKIADVAKLFWEKGISEQPPKFVIFIGGVGAGKTTVRRQECSTGFVHFEFGEIYNAIKKEFGDGNPRLVSYASLASDMILRESLENKKNIVIEIIGDNKEVIETLASKIKDLGYEIALKLVSCDPVEAYKRHIQAVSEDKEYLSAHFTQEATLSFLYDQLELGKLPNIYLYKEKAIEIDENL